VDNRLAYIDQGSFLAMRAHGHEPVQQLIWFYSNDVNVDRLREIQRDLGYTLLGRRIEKSPLPFGRHRWVAAPHQGDLLVSSARPRSEMMAWCDEQVTMGVDPELGPAWRMAVVPFSEGGAAVTLVVSHSLSDVGGILFSIFAAQAGMRPDLGYPPAGSRTKGQALRDDVKATLQSLPYIGRALKASLSILRQGQRTASREIRPAKQRETGTAIRPSVFPVMEAAEWDARAKALGGNSGSLVAAFAVRLGFIMGQMRSDGSVTLNFPVSDRKDADDRANALTGMSVTADPAEVLTSLTKIRADLKSGLKEVAEKPNQLLAPLPLTPITPKWLVRRMEWLVLGDGPVVGCTNIGEVPEALIQVDGTAADYMLARGVEWPIGPTELNRVGNWLLVGSCRMSGKLYLFITAWQVGKSNTGEELKGLATRALADFGLSGTFVEPADGHPDH
jgi:diacylglycerol O-acyltransferase